MSLRCVAVLFPPLSLLFPPLLLVGVLLGGPATFIDLPLRQGPWPTQHIPIEHDAALPEHDFLLRSPDRVDLLYLNGHLPPERREEALDVDNVAHVDVFRPFHLKVHLGRLETVGVAVVGFRPDDLDGDIALDACATAIVDGVHAPAEEVVNRDDGAHDACPFDREVAVVERVLAFGRELQERLAAVHVFAALTGEWGMEVEGVNGSRVHQTVRALRRGE